MVKEKRVDCECLTWGGTAIQAMMLGNGHHPNCGKYQPHDGAIQLLRELANGIKTWANEEDGVPDWLWDDYARAVFIVSGKILEPGNR